MIRVYTASKLSSAEMWRKLHDTWPHVFFHARWLKHNTVGTPDSKEHARKFWQEDEHDVRHAQAVLVYAEQGEHLRGALVEAGIAIACKIPVIVVGEHPDYDTWQYHPGVYRAPNFHGAAALLEQFDKEWTT